MNIELFSMVQRYKFESKSQLDVYYAAIPRRCFQWSKDTNLKANHNTPVESMPLWMLFSMVQRYKFESKSQRRWNNGINRTVVFNGPKIQI